MLAHEATRKTSQPKQAVVDSRGQTHWRYKSKASDRTLIGGYLAIACFWWFRQWVNNIFAEWASTNRYFKFITWLCHVVSKVLDPYPLPFEPNTACRFEIFSYALRQWAPDRFHRITSAQDTLCLSWVQRNRRAKNHHVGTLVGTKKMGIHHMIHSPILSGKWGKWSTSTFGDPRCQEFTHGLWDRSPLLRLIGLLRLRGFLKWSKMGGTPKSSKSWMIMI